MKVRVFKPLAGQSYPDISDFYFDALPTPGQTMVTVDKDTGAFSHRIVDKVGYMESDRDFIQAVWLHPEDYDPD